jgi:predicted ATPase
MIFSLSGTQGCGKTTILKSLSKMGFNVIKRKTSRSVLSDWNIKLSDIYSNQKLMMDFQSELISRKYSDEKDYINGDDIWFTDRSYVDLLIYSTIIIGHNNNNSVWLDLYYAQCKKYQSIYESVFYISPLPFIISDGVRNSNEAFNLMVDFSIHGYLKKFNRINIIEISSNSNSERVEQILKSLPKSKI